MKNICFSFNHLQFSDGVSKSVISIANQLVKFKDIQVTLRPIFHFDRNILRLIDDRIKVEPVFGFYFKGLAKIINILPDIILHDIIFGKEKYDIEVGFQYGIATQACVSTNNNANHILWMHGYDTEMTLRKYYSKADKIVCVSKDSAERLEKEISSNVEIDYCYNPIDEVDIINKGSEVTQNLKSDNVTFVTVGRLSKEKGYDRLINVTSKLLNDGYKFNVWIIGDGLQAGELRKKINDLGLNKEVTLFGEQVNPHKFTSKADIFVCSSLSEGYSTACTEAIILGIPVITTNIGGAKEIIESADCGIMCENSEEGLLYMMKEVLDNEELIEEWKNRLIQTKSNFYTRKRIVKMYDIFNL